MTQKKHDARLSISYDNRDICTAFFQCQLRSWTPLFDASAIATRPVALYMSTRSRRIYQTHQVSLLDMLLQHGYQSLTASYAP